MSAFMLKLIKPTCSFLSYHLHVEDLSGRPDDGEGVMERLTHIYAADDVGGSIIIHPLSFLDLPILNSIWALADTMTLLVGIHHR